MSILGITGFDVVVLQLPPLGDIIAVFVGVVLVIVGACKHQQKYRTCVKFLQSKQTMFLLPFVSLSISPFHSRCLTFRRYASLSASLSASFSIDFNETFTDKSQRRDLQKTNRISRSSLWCIWGCNLQERENNGERIAESTLVFRISSLLFLVFSL